MADNKDESGKKDKGLAEEIFREFKDLSGNRGTLESHWQEIAERIFPMHSNTFYQGYEFHTEGEKRTQELFDSTAARALNRFSAILDSLLTPRNQTWHRLLTDNTDLNKDREVQLWFEEATRILFKYRYAPKANFASQNQQNYKALGAYGTGCVFIDQLYGEPGLRYKNIHLGEVYFAENHQGQVDKAYRRFILTARQCYQKWGDKSPKRVLDSLENFPHRKFYFIHRVCPNEEYDERRRDIRGKPFLSHYISEEDRTLLQSGGYMTFPYAISRYEQAPNEVYGRSPAMDVLPDIKTLNEQKKTLLKQGHRTVDPILLAHDDGAVDTFSFVPGSMHGGGVSAEGRPLIHALPVGNVNVGRDMMEDERVGINDAFLVNLFQILVETPQMSATEVLERTKEKGILLAPTIGRQQSEYLGPLIERELDLLLMQGILPPLPPLLVEAGGDYRIEYDSPLTRSQRAEEASGIMRAVEYALSIVNVTQNLDPLDHFDFDVIIPEIASIQGVPSKWMRDPMIIAQMREGRAQQQQVQQAIEVAPSLASMAK